MHQFRTQLQTIISLRFLLDGTTDPNDKNPYKWKIPLTYTTESAPGDTKTKFDYKKAPLHWMEKDGTAFTLSSLTEAE